MKLIAFSVENYRRFVGRTSVKLNGPLIAFVGPNEAGKSSALRALARLHNGDDFSSDERPRRREGEPRLTWQFELEPDDVEAIAGIPEAEGVTRATLERRGGEGKRMWTFHPHPIERARGTRQAVLAALESLASELLPYASESGLHGPDLETVLAALSEDPSDFDKPHLEAFESLRLGLAHVLATPPGSDDALADRLRRPVSDLAERLQDLVEQEASKAPAAHAREVLVERLPQIMFFQEIDRELGSTYDLDQVVERPPAALKHLASLAGLDLAALHKEVIAGAIADVATRRNAANKRLLEAFDQGWNQQGIAIQVEVQGTVLHIQATTPEDSGLSSIEERSDGLRWFAALLAYAHGWKDRPILLVDEIETHLHYDAQADLIEVLAQQEFTSKVIYTTHSFGCLPPDLGTGVRVVEQIDGATSRFENGFWSRGAGFSPLLAAMGAAAVSLTPTRHAVLAEGPSEAILLPTLIRQALGRDSLRYHVAPGLAGVAEVAVEALDAEAGRVAFLVDGDVGGRAIVEKLLRGGVAEDRVTVLVDQATGDDLEIEDLVDPTAYLEAVNAEIRVWQDDAKPMLASDLSAPFVTKAVADWADQNGYAAPDRTAVAQRLADTAWDKRILNEERADTTTWLDDMFRRVLRLTANP